MDVLLGGTAEEFPQDRGDGVQAFLGGQGAGRISLHLEDDGRGEEL